MCWWGGKGKKRAREQARSAHRKRRRLLKRPSTSVSGRLGRARALAVMGAQTTTRQNADEGGRDETPRAGCAGPQLALALSKRRTLRTQRAARATQGGRAGGPRKLVGSRASGGRARDSERAAYCARSQARGKRRAGSGGGRRGGRRNLSDLFRHFHHLRTSVLAVGLYFVLASIAPFWVRTHRISRHAPGRRAPRPRAKTTGARPQSAGWAACVPLMITHSSSQSLHGLDGCRLPNGE